MIYLSQLILNPWSRGVIDDLNNPYKLHKRIMSAFIIPLPADERVLFRLDLQRNPPQAALLVQSHYSPDWEMLNQTDYFLHPANTKTLSPTFLTGQIFQFRLAANPTKRLRGENEKAGSRVGLYREKEQVVWLNKKGQMNGFEVLETQITRIIQPDGWKFDQKAQKWLCIRQHGVRFDGRLTVTDAVKFSLALSNGIGSGKGMGFGLLSLMRA